MFETAKNGTACSTLASAFISRFIVCGGQAEAQDDAIEVSFGKDRNFTFSNRVVALGPERLSSGQPPEEFSVDIGGCADQD